VLAIVDYGMGNLRSVQKAFERVGHPATITRSPTEVAGAERVVFPGVGAFGDAMANLNQTGLLEPLLEVIRSDRPFLGICLGLQLLLGGSEEMGSHEGLGVVPGKVRRFPEGERIPQIGWNQVRRQRESPLFSGIPEGAFFYFVHSYYADPDCGEHTVGITEYGIEYTSVTTSGRTFGVQFHPEKSQDAGLRMLRNFAELPG